MEDSIDIQIEEVLQKYPSLSFVKSDNQFVGEIIVDSEDNDEYLIQIDISPFPERFPNVKEIGERIPPKGHRHIYEDTGCCCFTTLANEQVLLKTKINSLLKFVDQIVIKYLQNNSFYEINNRYKNGEYLHGGPGTLQGYKDILNLPYYQIPLALILRIENRKFDRRAPCYFCGNKKMRKCHLHNFRKLYLVDDEIISNDLIEIQKTLKSLH